MSSNITLYRANGACSLVPHILLRELDIPFTAHRMSFSPTGVFGVDGNLSHSEYLKINPAGFVPALRISDGSGNAGEIITENPAILTYIAGLKSERQLFGRDDLEQAKVYQWLCWLSGSLHGYGYGMILRPGRFADDVATQAKIVEKGRKKILECYERIESSLNGEHAVGDGLTVADINMYALCFTRAPLPRRIADLIRYIFWGWGKRNNFEMNQQYPKYGRLVRAVEKIESVRLALEDEGLPLQFP